MKKILILIAFITIYGSFASYAKGKNLNNVFYCFYNAMRLPNAPVGYEEQAKLAKRLGYSGIAGHTEDSYYQLRKALDNSGIAMPEIYISLKIDSGVPNFNPLLKELIKDSKDRDLLVTLHLHSELYKNNKEKGDVKFAEVLTELADYAAKYNVKLAIYPHFSFYCETFSHTLKLVKMVNRPNLGAVFNLCHFLKVQGQENMEVQLKESIPYLFMVSLSGADTGDTKTMDWDRLIQPLGKGSYDPYPIVKLLKDNDYKGRFGLQCYNIKMDCEPALTQSMNTWEAYKKRYSEGK